MQQLSIVEVLQARSYPDDAWFGVAASTTSSLLVVCGGRNIALREKKWHINVDTDSTEEHCIKAMRSISLVEVLLTQYNAHRFRTNKKSESPLSPFFGGLEGYYESFY